MRLLPQGADLQTSSSKFFSEPFETLLVRIHPPLVLAHRVTAEKQRLPLATRRKRWRHSVEILAEAADLQFEGPLPITKADGCLTLAAVAIGDVEFDPLARFHPGKLLHRLFH